MFHYRILQFYNDGLHAKVSAAHFSVLPARFFHFKLFSTRFFFCSYVRLHLSVWLWICLWEREIWTLELWTWHGLRCDRPTSRIVLWLLKCKRTARKRKLEEYAPKCGVSGVEMTIIPWVHEIDACQCQRQLAIIFLPVQRRQKWTERKEQSNHHAGRQADGESSTKPNVNTSRAQTGNM